MGRRGEGGKEKEKMIWEEERKSITYNKNLELPTLIE
jgi:hypothetical protein